MKRPRTQRVAVLAAVSLVLLMIVALGARRIWTVDYWWQWKTGEFVSQQGIPDKAIYSYTNPDHERLELRWGYCLGLYQTGEWLGRGSAVVIKCLLLVVTFALAASIAAKRDNLLTATLVTAVGALAASQRFFVRPEVLSYLWLAVFLVIVDSARRRATRWVLVLPAAQVLWVNTHSFFMLGPMIVGAWLGAEGLGLVANRALRRPADADRPRRLKTASGLLVATLLASLINPYLHRALLLPIVQFQALHGTSMKGFYAELYSPFAIQQPFTALFYYKVLIGLAVVSALINLRRLEPYWAVVVSMLFYFSAISIRNLPLFCIAAIPFVVGNISNSSIWTRWRLARLLPGGRLVTATLLAVFCAYQVTELYTNHFNLKQGDSNQFGIGLAHHRYPVGGTQFLKRTDVEGPIFNSSEAGSYLMAHGFQVFIDPRGEVYQDGIIDEYRRIVQDPLAASESIERYGFRAFFLETEMTSLIAYLYGEPSWRIVYADAVTTILFREETAPQVPAIDLRDERWLTETRSRLGRPVPYANRGWTEQLASPKPYTRLARLCLTLQAYAAARTLFEDALAAYPPGFTDFEPLAFAADKSGDDEAAIRYYQDAIRRDPERRELRKRLAFVHFRRGETDRAIVELDLFFRDHPDDAEAMALRGNIELRRGRPAEAADWLERAIAATPDESLYRYYHARLLLGLGRFDQAQGSLEEAFRLDPSNPQVALDLAELHARQGRPESARTWLGRARALAPTDPRLLELERRLAEPR
jgi:tetratricopeptide (TPR) repeat protein